MIVRLWRAQVSATHRKEFEHIAEQHLATLLEKQPGFGGVLFLHQEDEATILSMWTDRHSAEEFQGMPDVQRLASEVRDRGIVQGEPRVEIFEVSGGSFKGL
ncbi:MAG TPA: antibiotic biosynthesis monooxygenase [Terriglobales bacterium]